MEEYLAAFFQTLGPRFLVEGDFNSKHTLWGSRLVSTRGRELTKIIQTNNFSYLSTGSPNYWPTDPNKTPELLDFSISTNYAEVEASYDLTSDHSPIIATISMTVMTRQTPPRLHTEQTNWDTYKISISENVELRPKIKEREVIKLATDKFIRALQHAANIATPIRTPQRPSTTLPLDIKRLVALKRRARAKWQQSHSPADRHLYNTASNKLDHPSQTVERLLRKLRHYS
jgi:hypothetical protein